MNDTAASGALDAVVTMGESFDFPRADVFWPGADGPPGQRVFFLAGGDEGGLVYLRCEKQQVAALGEYLLALLEDLSPDVEPADGPGAVTPLPFAWDVGSIGVKYDEPERPHRGGPRGAGRRGREAGDRPVLLHAPPGQGLRALRPRPGVPGAARLRGSAACRWIPTATHARG